VLADSSGFHRSPAVDEFGEREEKNGEKVVE
jgi:hypothetical protein